MKKLVVLAAAICVVLAGCNKKSLPQNTNVYVDEGEYVAAVSVPKGGQSFYIDEAIKLTKESGELAKTDEFIAMYTADEKVAGQIKSIGNIDYENPKSIKYLYFNKDKILEFLEASMPEDEAEINFERVIELNRFSINHLASLINSRHGASMIAATAVLANSKGYVMPEDFQKDFAVCLEYDGDFSSVVSFKEYGDNVISANMTFVKNDKEQIDMLMQEVIDALGEESVTVETVVREQK